MTILLPTLVCSIGQGHALYSGNEVNKFYPIVYGEDIASADSDEDSAR